MRNLMNGTSARHALLGTLLIIALGAAGCSESKSQAADDKPARSAATPASDAPAKHVIHLDGYPLSRTFDDMVHMRGVDTIVVITAIKAGKPEFTGTDTPGDDWDAPGDFIMTPVDATVSRVFRGTAQAGDPVRMTLNGGRIGDYEAIASTEISAQLEDIAKYSRLVVAGETIDSLQFGRVLNPGFVYGIDADGQATSLLESAGDEKLPTFPITALRDADLTR